MDTNSNLASALDFFDLGNFDKILKTYFPDTICPFCGHDFNRTVRQVAEFSIGLFFACLFTFQLIPILVTIGPALVRASVLILIHPGIYFFLNLSFLSLILKLK